MCQIIATRCPSHCDKLTRDFAAFITGSRGAGQRVAGLQLQTVSMAPARYSSFARPVVLRSLAKERHRRKAIRDKSYALQFDCGCKPRQNRTPRNVLSLADSLSLQRGDDGTRTPRPPHSVRGPPLSRRTPKSRHLTESPARWPVRADSQRTRAAVAIGGSPTGTCGSRAASRPRRRGARNTATPRDAVRRPIAS